MTLDPAISAHKGRIVRSMGDGLLVEFNSVVDAVTCAVKLQGEMPEHTAEMPADQASLITDFTEHLQKKTVNGQPFFASVDSAPWQRNPGGSTVTWSIRAEIAHGEGE